MESNTYNFFKFLEAKKGEKIPIEYRLIYEPQVVEKELDEDGLLTLIQNLTNGQRAKYYNNKLGKNIYKSVTDFERYDQPFLFARATKMDNMPQFIDIHGNDVFDLINIEKLLGVSALQYTASYFNIKKNELKFRRVFGFGYADGNIALAELIDGSFTFIDKNGNESIEGINVDSLSDTYMRAKYFNLKLNTDIFVGVERFNYENRTQAYARLKGNRQVVINREGEIIREIK